MTEKKKKTRKGLCTRTYIVRTSKARPHVLQKYEALFSLSEKKTNEAKHTHKRKSKKHDEYRQRQTRAFLEKKKKSTHTHTKKRTRQNDATRRQATLKLTRGFLVTLKAEQDSLK